MPLTTVRNLKVAALAGTAICLAPQAVAQDKLTITLDTPPTHVRNIWIGKFAKALTERSGGKMTVKIFDSGQLYSSRDAGKAVARGDVGMAIVAAPALGRIEANLNVLDLPIFNGMTQERMNAVVDGPLGRTLSGMVAKKMGVNVPGGWYVLGALNTYSTRTAIKSYGDLKGLRVRIPGSAGWIARYKALGAIAVSMPFSDVPLALQQGAVDAIVTSNVSILSAKLYESGLKYAFLNRVGIGYYVPIVSRGYWNRLSAKQQQLFRATWNEFVPGQRTAAASDQAKARAKLEALGMVFAEPTKEDTAKARKTLARLQAGLVKNLRISPEIRALAEKAAQ